MSDTYSNKPGRMTGAAATAFCARTMLYHAYDDKGVANKTEMAEILGQVKHYYGFLSLATDVLDNFHTSAQSTLP